MLASAQTATRTVVGRDCSDFTKVMRKRMSLFSMKLSKAAYRRLRAIRFRFLESYRKYAKWLVFSPMIK